MRIRNLKYNEVLDRSQLEGRGSFRYLSDSSVGELGLRRL